MAEYNSRRRPAGRNGKGRTRGDRRERPSKASPARLFALQVGKTVRERDAFAHDVIAANADNASLTEEDKAFATKLALGVTMASGTLDEVIDRYVTNPKDLSADVRDALRVSAYEILFLEKSPHAAVDQGVELVRAVNPRAAGLANAVLRKIVNARAEFPFGNPDVSLLALARKNAFPVWMAKTVLDDRGLEELKRFMAASNEVAPLYVSVNALKADEQDVLEVLESAHAEPQAVEVNERALNRCWLLKNHRVVGHPAVKKLLADGSLIVSDASAQAIAEMAVPSEMPGRFLEVGAGRGTKSILLQNVALARFGEQMPLETLDNHEFKTKIQLRRAALANVRLVDAHTVDARRLHATFGDDAFDAVFVDAPCSGLGTLRRHPEIRWRLSPKDVNALSALNVSILQEAALCVKTGGILTYATCTVTRKENEQVVERFVKSTIGERFKVVPLGHAGEPFFSGNLASGGPDAHFAAQFVRVR